MKPMAPLLSAVALLATSGCLSTHLVNDKARPHLEYNSAEDNFKEVNGQPGYYALLPLTVVGDVTISPFQLGYFLLTDNSHWSRADIRGVPIPMP